MLKDDKTKLHSLSEGQRVHYLANLGGLVVIAGLEQLEPALLVGVLCELSMRIPKLSSIRVAELKQRGMDRLVARNAEKRSFNTWQRAKKSERFDFTLDEMKQLIMALGGQLPTLDKDIGSELRRLVRGITHGA